MNEIAVSILFATYKRGEILRTTLDSLAKLASGSFSYEIIVIDNACESKIAELVNSFSNQMPVFYMQEPKPGKNSALLTGLTRARGDILVFTDDDVIVEPNWLNELVAGIHRMPEHDLFGGKILPYLMEGARDDLGLLNRDGSFIKSAYVIADWNIPEGAIKVGHIWGPNMAVRRRVFETGVTFDASIGPNGSNYIMGSESDFLNRAAALGFTGAYIPSAVVKHQIRAEQLNPSWLAGRAYRWGRGSVRRSPPKSRFSFRNAPTYLYRKCALQGLAYLFAKSLKQDNWIEKMINFNVTKGALTQMILDRKARKS